MKKERLQPTHEEREMFESEEQFEDYLNDIYEDVLICGMSMQKGSILRKCDPIAFRCAMADSQEYTDVYICPICDEEHEDEEDALYCCQNEDDEEDEDFSCNQCNAMMINGIYCHETGCLNADKIKVDDEWVEREIEDEY
jgi:hypothetical protein